MTTIYFIYFSRVVPALIYTKNWRANSVLYLWLVLLPRWSSLQQQARHPANAVDVAPVVPSNVTSTWIVVVPMTDEEAAVSSFVLDVANVDIETSGFGLLLSVVLKGWTDVVST